MSDKVYYDESCYVCSLEINAIRKRGEACGIEFVDISDPEFAGDGADYETPMMGEFNGEPTVGVETFRTMYERMGYRKSVAVSRFPVIKQLVDLGYLGFAYGIRPYLPKKRRK